MPGVASGLAAPLLETLLESGLLVRVVVTGTSMGRTLRSGDTVVLSPAGRTPPVPGDLVLFRDRCARLVLHRVVRRHPGPVGTLQTRGDALVRLDDPIPHHRVLGQVLEIHRGSVNGLRIYRLNATGARCTGHLRAGFALAQSGCAYLAHRLTGGRLFPALGLGRPR